MFTVGAQRSPTISYISQEQIVDLGGTVELQCSVQYAQNYPVLWMKADPRTNSYVLPISTGSSLILHDSRFALRYDMVSTTPKTTTFINAPFSGQFHLHTSNPRYTRNGRRYIPMPGSHLYRQPDLCGGAAADQEAPFHLRQLH